ncbi:MAG: hypothetical protein ABMB14_24020 [Myxococcota bacterium]
MGDEQHDDTEDDEILTTTTAPAAWEARIKEERRKLRKANERISTLENELTGLRPKAQTAQNLNSQIETLRKQHESEKAAWEIEKAAMGAGITDADGVEVARLFHGRLPEKDRPAIGAWLGELRKDPTKAPKPLQPYLVTEAAATGETAAAAATTVAAKTTAARPNPNGGVVIAANTSVTTNKPTKAEWDAARAKLRTGDRTDFDALTAREGLRPLVRETK